jgi:hypothetical protein
MAELTRKQSLAAIPVAAILDEQPLDSGGARIAIAVGTRPLQRKLLRLPETIRREFDLDAFGVQIIRWCNGKNTIGDLLRLFGEKYKLDPHESERALLTFIRSLVSKGVIVLTLRRNT